MNLIDNFDAANTTNGLNGRALSGTPSVNWEVLGTAVMGIASNAAKATTLGSDTRAYAVADSGSNVGEITYTKTSIDNGDNRLILRAVSNTNHYSFSPSSGVLHRWVSGSPTAIGSTTGSLTNGNVIVFGVGADNVFYVKVNGVTVITSAAQTTHAAATKHGFAFGVTNSSYDNFAFTDLAVASNTVTCNDFPAGRKIQRIGTSRQVVFTGAYTGEVPNNVQVQIYLADRTTIKQAWASLTSATISGGFITGTISVPQGGSKNELFTYAMRTRNSVNSVLATTAAVTTNLWGVGDLIAIFGSSSAHRMLTSDGGTGLASESGVTKYNDSNVWEPMGTVGAFIKVANAMNNLRNVPIGVISAAVPGSLVDGWYNSASSEFTGLASKISALGGKIWTAWGVMGSNDAAAGSVASKVSHASKLRTFVSNLRTLLGQSDLKVFFSGTNSRTSANNQQFDWVRQAEHEVCEDVNVYLSNSTYDLAVTGDNTHVIPTDMLVWGDRITQGFSAIFGTAPYFRGAKIIFFAASGSTAVITFSHNPSGSNLSVAAERGLVFSDSSGALAVNSSSVTDGTHVAITFARPINGPVLMKYITGARPIAAYNGIHDNTALALPVEVLPEGLNSSNYALSGVDFSPTLVLSNGVTITDGNLNVPSGVTSFTASLTTISDSVIEIVPEIVDFTVGGIKGTGTITDLVTSLSQLTEVAVIETPYGLLDTAQRALVAADGGFPMFAASRKNAESPSFGVLESTDGVIFTQVLFDQAYTPSASSNSYVDYDHQTLSIGDEVNFPGTILPNTVCLLADSIGQKEWFYAHSVEDIPSGGATSRVLKNITQAIFDSVPIRVGDDNPSRIFVIGNTPSILNSKRAHDAIRYYKIVPKLPAGGYLDHASAPAIALTIESVVRKPYPPRMIAFGAAATREEGAKYWPEGVSGDRIRAFFEPSSKIDETISSGFFKSSGLNETGVVYKMRVRRILDGTLTRTLTRSGSDPFVYYSEAQKTADKTARIAQYEVFSEKGGFESKPLIWKLEAGQFYLSGVDTAVASVVSTNVEILVDMTFTTGDPNPSDNRFVFFKLTGTLLAHLNTNSITFNNSVEMFERLMSDDGVQFVVQLVNTSIENFKVFIPYTASGASGKSLVTRAGATDNLSPINTLTIPQEFL